MKDKCTKQLENGDINFNCLYFNKPQIVKKCKENVNLIYHVYTITYKNDGKIYVGQSVNPQKKFKPHVFNPSKQMIVDVNIYKPFVNYFGFTIFFFVKKLFMTL
jgi:DNA-directed RNA polymerase subunit E'/Rpb7